MAWGFEAINNAGAIQIDGNFSNFSMFKKGGWYFGGQEWYDLYSFRNAEIIEFPERQGPPLVAMQPGAINYRSHCGLIAMGATDRVYEDGQRVNSVYLRYGNDNYYGQPIDHGYCEVNWGLFDQKGDVLDDTDWGMQVFNDQEEVMFDSRASYLEVIEEINVVIPPPIRYKTNWGEVYYLPDYGPLTLNHSAEPNAWYVISTMTGATALALGPFLGNNARMGLTVQQISDSQVQLEWSFGFGSTSSPEPSDSRIDGKILLCREKFI